MRSLKRGKGAALEMSIGTIVIIVIAMTMLILGLVLVRKIMCSGVVLTDKISQEVENQLKDLFNSGEVGVKCMGEEGQQVTLGGGGRRQIICIINTDQSGLYKFQVENIEQVSNQGTVDEDWLVYGESVIQKQVNPGRTTVTVATLDLPRNLDSVGILVNLKVTLPGTNVAEDRDLFIDASPVGAFASVIC